MRDPRKFPMPFDVLDDDPGNAVLVVTGTWKGKVSASRYAHTTDVPCACKQEDPLHPYACDCKGCTCTELGAAWTPDQWAKEMEEATVIRRGDGPSTYILAGFTDDVSKLGVDPRRYVSVSSPRHVFPELGIRYFHPSRLFGISEDDAIAMGLTLWPQQDDGSW